MSPSGILNVNKDEGMSSHDVVALVRKGARPAKVGHAGTLDPLATGVLIILVGQAVRISEYVMDLPKSYRVTMTLGAATTTYDREGEVTSTAPVVVDEAQFREALARFTGEIEQTPPPYSAAKVGGKRAYRLAREGKQVDLQPRKVRVYRAELLRFEPPEAEIEVECGKGTYVRSIAHDLGQALGCGAHASRLTRTRVGPFDIAASAPVGQLRDAVANGTWVELLRPLDMGLLHLPALTVEIEDEKDLRHGQPASIAGGALNPPAALTDGIVARGYAEDGSLIGILGYDGRTGMWRPRKVFG